MNLFIAIFYIFISLENFNKRKLIDISFHFIYSEIQRITSNAPLTPWFRLILTNKLLVNWWDNLSQLKKLQDHQIIQKL